VILETETLKYMSSGQQYHSPPLIFIMKQVHMKRLL